MDELACTRPTIGWSLPSKSALNLVSPPGQRGNHAYTYRGLTHPNYGAADYGRLHHAGPYPIGLDVSPVGNKYDAEIQPGKGGEKSGFRRRDRQDHRGARLRVR